MNASTSLPTWTTSQSSIRFERQKNADIAENLRLAEEKGKELEDQASIVTSEKESANEKIVKLSDEISKLQKVHYFGCFYVC